MLDDDTQSNAESDTTETPEATRPRRRAAGRPAGPPAALTDIFAAPEIEVQPARKDAEAESDDADQRAGGQSKPKAKAQGQGQNKTKSQGQGKNQGQGKKQANAKDEATEKPDAEDESVDEDSSDDDETGDGQTRRRRRRRGGRRRSGGSESDSDESADAPDNGGVTAVTGSTRLEAKKQRRREGREAGRRRAPILTEAEFLARREAVNREMVVRQHADHTQIAVLEDGVLVEHYVARESQTSLIGNVYMGKVQNVLPSMEAAFVDIGQGRNAVIYAGEVDWSALENGKQRKIEEVLKPGQSILVQVTKDPVGQKGARLSSQVSLPGRFLVLVPGGSSSGISRKLPDAERARLKDLLKEVLPEGAGFIVRTAAEGATEEQLTRDISALTARWEDIQRKVEAGKAPELLYSEPDLRIKVVRDLFNEDFAKLVVEGPDAWDDLSGYVQHVAPDLADRLQKWEPEEGQPSDSFAAKRIDEQIDKALLRTVHLPSGGSLVIDRTEAMTVVDVNTGKFTGSGGNLEETVTKNNLEAAEEIVRQLRLRDIGGIIVVDFIDMVLESNRDLVLRRLVECLGRDRTRHQVAEVTSLGLVQMTRKRIGTGLLESFSHKCEHCNGRGVVVEAAPIEPKSEPRQRHGQGQGAGQGQARNRRGGRGRGGGQGGQAKSGEQNDAATSDDAATEPVLTDTPAAP